jgi:hypothetical protein
MLAKQTEIQIPPITAITCHVAVWYWAWRVAEAQGAVKGVLEPRDLLIKINEMVNGAQEAMKLLPRSGQWDLKSPLLTPPLDTVLFWADGATHTAVVTGTARITGYNQGFIYGKTPAPVLTTITTAEILPQYKLCFTISEKTLLAAAASDRFGVYPG